MRRRARIVAMCVLACAGLAGCRKLETNYVGELQVVPTELTDSIPKDYGRLVSVSSDRDLLRLVFERADQALVVVTLSTDRESIANRVIVVPRQ
jgi:hypothetical protein